MSDRGSGQRTEKATKKKREKARKEGQVLKSTEINTAFSVVALFAFLYILWEYFSRSARQLLTKYLSGGFISGSSEQISALQVKHLYAGALVDSLKIVIPVFLVAMLCAALIHVLQTGFLFTPKALMPKFSKINPLEGMKRILSTRSLVEMLKATVKVVCLCWLVYGEYMGLLDTFPKMMLMDIRKSFPQVMLVSFRIAIKMGAVLIAIAALDYFYQWWRYEKDLRMTKQEVKEEYKQLEGDPQIKSRIRRIQRQMSRMRMMRRVPEADVVITNPTHYAVAIRYKEKVDNAPLVLAKGADYVAKKIKEVAALHQIEIVENKPVAQALYHSCEVGDEIPEDMYRTIAEILVYVYRIKNKMR